MQINTLINQAALALNDLSFTRWTQDELLGYLNKAVVVLIGYRPDASTVNKRFTCVADTMQTFSADELRLIDVVRNVETGEPIKYMDKNTIDTIIPRWHNEAMEDDVEFYMYDDRIPKTFYLYPYPPAGHEIDLVFSVLPPPIVVDDWNTNNVALPLDDIYQVALAHYILYQAYGKDTAVGNIQKSMLELQAFASVLNVKLKMDIAASPESNQ